MKAGQERERPRDFTDKTLNIHEFQTLKAKLECSEITLSEKMRDIQNYELQLKCLEEQKLEIEKRNEILAKSHSSTEEVLNLFREDLDALRAKLELKNQVSKDSKRNSC